MLEVVTTVAQHPRGLDLHLRNLRWALAGCDSRIRVLTFSAWGFERADAELVQIPDHDPMEHFLFWDDFTPRAARLARPGNAFLFMQQDILFTANVAGRVLRAVDSGRAAVHLESPFLAVFDSSRRKVYPRIWEGATVVPGATLAAALADGVTLGCYHRALRPGTELFERHRPRLEAHLTTKGGPGDDFWPLAELLARPATDTMTELTAWCFLHGVEVERDPLNDRDYELGADVVHLRGPESMHIDHPETYADPRAMWAAGPRYDRRLPDCALMYLLAGVHHPSPEMARLLCAGAGARLLREKLTRLREHAAEWMSADQLERLRWAAAAVGL